MHQFPKDEVVRQKWVKFVQRQAFMQKPKQVLFLMFCTFWRYFRPQTDSTGVSWRGNLIKGSFPTRDSVHLPSPKKTSCRSKRLVSRPKFSIVSCRPEFGLFILAIFIQNVCIAISFLRLEFIWNNIILNWFVVLWKYHRKKNSRKWEHQWVNATMFFQLSVWRELCYLFIYRWWFRPNSCCRTVCWQRNINYNANPPKVCIVHWEGEKAGLCRRKWHAYR